MTAYTKQQFQEYKGDKKCLSVGYEYPKGNWEWIDHETYEDYINTLDSYLDMFNLDSTNSVEK